MSMSTSDINNSKPVHTLISTPVAIVLTGGLVFIILTTFFSFFFFGSYFKKLLANWTNRNQIPSANLIQPSNNPQEKTGLDSKIIQSFPVFPYSVRDRGVDKCSICLTDLMDEDTMRLISTCNHFFHTICIDLWFESHTTCPVCRHELDVDQTSIIKLPAVPEIDHMVRSESHEEPLSRDTLTIIVHEEHPTTTVGSLDQTDEAENYERRMKASNLRFWRSHSTGHSIVIKTDNEQEEEEEEEKDEIKIRIEISGECQFEDYKRILPNRNLYCVRGTYSVG